MKTKIKDGISTAVGLVIFFVIVLAAVPFLLLWFVFKLLMTPFDYVKYKRSRYQQDFPRKYKWLCEPHSDNEAYTVVIENSLPIEYVKRSGNYDLSGFFGHKDILLIFDEPFFFEKERGLWLMEKAATDIGEEECV